MQLNDEKKRQTKKVIEELLNVARKMDVKWQEDYKEILFLLDKADRAVEKEDFALAAEMIGQVEARLQR